MAVRRPEEACGHPGSAQERAGGVTGRGASVSEVGGGGLTLAFCAKPVVDV